MRIMIVDDHAHNRALLRFILEDEGYACVEAASGAEAIAQFASDTAIDFVLMDVSMPQMDGIEATTRLLAAKAERYVTIIFVTALDDADVLVKCLEAGGDDFVPKPVNEQVLLAKVRAHLRNQGTYSRLRETHAQLQVHHRAIEREHHIVEYIFANGIDRAASFCANVEVYSSPMSMFNGDLVLTAPSSDGGLYLFIGDFTGHGLASAVGCLPVTSLFFQAAARHASVAEIARKLNQELHLILPVGMFCCASVLYLDASGTRMTIWSGGMLDALFIQNDTVLRIGSDHMPLGIAKASEFSDAVKQVELSTGGFLCLYTDGVNEAKNSADEEFGEERIETWLRQRCDKPVTDLVRQVHQFQGDAHQRDDISVVGIRCDALQHTLKNALQSAAASDLQPVLLPWRLSLCLDDQLLKNDSLIREVVAHLGSVQLLEAHGDRLFAVLSELYNNALEHSLLELDSAIKNTTEGFARYYQLRQQKLNLLAGQTMQLTIEYQSLERSLHITLEDSGRGFSPGRTNTDAALTDQTHGRGLLVLQSLCKSVQFSEDGRCAKAVYALG